MYTFLGHSLTSGPGCRVRFCGPLREVPDCLSDMPQIVNRTCLGTTARPGLAEIPGFGPGEQGGSLPWILRLAGYGFLIGFADLIRMRQQMAHLPHLRVRE